MPLHANRGRRSSAQAHSVVKLFPWLREALYVEPEIALNPVGHLQGQRAGRQGDFNDLRCEKGEDK